MSVSSQYFGCGSIFDLVVHGFAEDDWEQRRPSKKAERYNARTKAGAEMTIMQTDAGCRIFVGKIAMPVSSIIRNGQR